MSANRRRGFAFLLGQPVQVIGETPKRFRIRRRPGSGRRIRLPSRCWMGTGVALVSKRFVTLEAEP